MDFNVLPAAMFWKKLHSNTLNTYEGKISFLVACNEKTPMSCSLPSSLILPPNSLSIWVRARQRGAPGSRLRSQSFPPAVLLKAVPLLSLSALSLLSPLLLLLCCSGCSSRCTLANSPQWRRPEHLACHFPTPLLFFPAPLPRSFADLPLTSCLPIARPPG